MEKTQKFKRVPPEVQVKDLTPLDITCGSTKCEEGLHCFKASQRVIKKFGRSGVCKECGADLIDWERIHKKDLKDAKYTFEAMKHELIRHVFWHTKIDEEAIEKAKKFGTIKLKTRALKQVKQKIGKAQNYREGRQTPMTGDEVISYAQHATATCCRKCLEYWHNIQMGKELSEEELEYCAELIMLYIEDRVPGLSSEGE